MFFELFMKAIRHCIRVVLNATGGCQIEIKKRKEDTFMQTFKHRKAKLLNNYLHNAENKQRNTIICFYPK